MTDGAEKVKENKLRRMAARRGYRLVKSRARDRRALGYGGYILIDTQINAVVVGGNPFAYSASLDDVEDFFAD
ncbi:MAG: hypothetical protein AB7P22_06655 [Vicinamibacterales bacterium]